MSGLALFFSGSLYDEDAIDVSGPVNTSMCVFERNNAGDGGAIYSNAGYDMITDSRFKENVAGITPSEVASSALQSCSRERSRLPRNVCSASLPATLYTEQRRE